MREFFDGFPGNLPTDRVALAYAAIGGLLAPFGVYPVSAAFLICALLLLAADE